MALERQHVYAPDVSVVQVRSATAWTLFSGK